jgi:hypothetical protein
LQKPLGEAKKLPQAVFIFARRISVAAAYPTENRFGREKRYSRVLQIFTISTGNTGWSGITPKVKLPSS